jgi:hypothetical protein
VGAARWWRMMEGLVSLNRFAQPSRHTAIPLIGGIRVGKSAAASGRQRSLVHGLRSPDWRVNAARKQAEKVACGSLVLFSVLYRQPAVKMTTSDSHPWRTNWWMILHIWIAILQELCTAAEVVHGLSKVQLADGR